MIFSDSSLYLYDKTFSKNYTSRLAEFLSFCYFSRGINMTLSYMDRTKINKGIYHISDSCWARSFRLFCVAYRIIEKITGGHWTRHGRISPSRSVKAVPRNWKKWRTLWFRSLYLLRKYIKHTNQKIRHLSTWAIWCTEQLVFCG